jgi:2-iminobutanoate/2-iminopropanoate deaminase
MSSKTSRRWMLSKGLAVAAVATAPAMAAAEGKPVKKVHWEGGQAPAKTPLYSPAVSYGGLVFVSGIGAHYKGDVKAHTKTVLDEMQQRLEAAGSSMAKVLKVSVFLNDLKDYAAMNEVSRADSGTSRRCARRWPRPAVSPVIPWWRWTASLTSDPPAREEEETLNRWLGRDVFWGGRNGHLRGFGCQVAIARRVVARGREPLRGDRGSAAHQMPRYLPIPSSAGRSRGPRSNGPWTTPRTTTST